jgi:predicted kinase
MTFVCEVDEAVLQRRLAIRESGPSDARAELWPRLRTASSPPGEMQQAVERTTGPPASAVSHVMAVLADLDRCRADARSGLERGACLHQAAL